MMLPQVFSTASTLMPGMLMLAALLPPKVPAVPTTRLWQAFAALSGVALAFALTNAFTATIVLNMQPWLRPTRLGIGLAVLVQFLGTVIGVFSSRYLQGEAGQRRYVAALAGVLSAVHLLLLADHWLVLVVAWAVVGTALQQLLCFYPDRPFAQLAAHKKRIADRAANILLVGAGALIWTEVGSGSFTDLWTHLDRQGMSTSLQLGAVCLALAVILRTALLPAHGWLIQVMEAPTPVSALLHAGVVNLGGYVLIRFAPLLGQAMPARALLLVFGLGTAVLAGLVMLTRISIKVQLAWSTVAQMGFMVLECGLGLYQLALLHLIGHSLYKAHAFLSASGTVRQTRLKRMQGLSSTQPVSLFTAPVLSLAAIMLVQWLAKTDAWPWWWTGVLALAWAPLFWLPTQTGGIRVADWLLGISGFCMTALLTAAALLWHQGSMGVTNDPDLVAGLVALAGMVLMYLGLVTLQARPSLLAAWRCWSYAGFYIDERYTRIALKFWPTRWANTASTAFPPATP